MKKPAAPTIGKVDKHNKLTTWYRFKSEDMEKNPEKYLQWVLLLALMAMPMLLICNYAFMAQAAEFSHDAVAMRVASVMAFPFIGVKTGILNITL